MLTHGGRHPHRRHSALGFSIVELMITVTVLILLLALMGAGMGDWMANVRLRNTAEIAVAGLQKARAEAIKSNQVLTFWLVSPATAATLGDTCALSSTSPSWVVSQDSPEGACSGAPSTTTSPRIVEARGGGDSARDVTVLALNGVGAAANLVAFDGFGQVVNPGGSIRTIDFTSTTSGTRRLRVQISMAGGVRMCDRDVPDTDPRNC